MLFSEKRITKGLIRLCGCAGWSGPLLFANLRGQVFSCCSPDCHFSDKVRLTLIYNLPILVLKMLSACMSAAMGTSD